jgi:hypothetical protein
VKKKENLATVYICITFWQFVYLIGAGIEMGRFSSTIICNGTWSNEFGIGLSILNKKSIFFFKIKKGINNGTEITAVVSVSEKERKMYFLKDGDIVPHTIVNLPSDGVYLGVLYILLNMYIDY